MRISDWSSDVCSSDLRNNFRAQPAGRRRQRHAEPPCGARTSTSGTLASSPARKVARLVRSEEHTSELQSLIRISYAVFCLKKQKTSYTILLLDTTHLFSFFSLILIYSISPTSY